MDVRFSAEQSALRDAAAQIVDHLGPKAVGQFADAERATKLDAAVAAAGWRELRAADEQGAPWASGVEVAIVAEELGRGLADASFLGPVLAADLRTRVGAPPANGLETIALSADLSRLSTIAPGRDVLGDAVVLDGRGCEAALVLVPVERGHALGTIAVGPADATTDLTRPPGVVTGDAVVDVDQRTVLDRDALEAWTALGLAATSADLVGVMAGAVALATEYAKERNQYDRAIGSFQAVQHLLADALVATEGSRSIAVHAAWAVDALSPAEALAAAAAAKAYCSRAARDVCEIAIQVHGGIGNTWECLAHVHLRRALLSTDVLGGVGPNLARVLEHDGIGGAAGRREQHAVR
jgi:alkylation response protein AidB-like acyl-CoA dehydrogenase